MSKKNKNEKIHHRLVLNYKSISYFPDIMEILLVVYISIIPITAKEMARLQDSSFLHEFIHNPNYFSASTHKIHEKKSIGISKIQKSRTMKNAYKPTMLS